MRLRDAIKHAEETAKKLPKGSKYAKEHLQLAKWLRELQKFRADSIYRENCFLESCYGWGLHGKARARLNRVSSNNRTKS